MSDDNTMDSVMIDLETMGLCPDAAIVSIGAVRMSTRVTLARLNVS